MSNQTNQTIPLAETGKRQTGRTTKLLEGLLDLLLESEGPGSFFFVVHSTSFGMRHVWDILVQMLYRKCGDVKMRRYDLTVVFPGNKYLKIISKGALTRLAIGRLDTVVWDHYAIGEQYNA